MRTVALVAVLLASGALRGPSVLADPSCCGGGKPGPAASTISAAELEALLASEARPIVVDVLSPEAYHKAHIRGAINIPLAHLKSLHKRLSKDATIVTYCSGPSCTASVKAAAFLRDQGYRDVREYRGGIQEWSNSGRPVVKGEPVRFVSRDELAKSRENVFLVDVLPAASFEKAHIAGAVSIPLAELEAKAAGLDRERPIVTYCASYVCNASTKAAVLLAKLGFKDVRDYKGGLHEWREAGLPVGGSEAAAGAEASSGPSGARGPASGCPGGGCASASVDP